MTNAFFAQWQQGLEQFTAPWLQCQQTWLDSLEKLAQLQLSSASFYSELSIEQLHNVSQLRDPENWSALTEQQQHHFGALVERLNADCGQMNETLKACQAAWQQLLSQSPQFSQ
ncbi:hypothetical protein GCM10025772_26240 [Ferrimonas gelatinilytica]|uniref:Phasin domain-containing protein n=2 Tax=Ferrimonas gelatinilytica TaxID=1255257 RepID=A0ABP9SEJ8_9GAMM